MTLILALVVGLALVAWGQSMADEGVGFFTALSLIVGVMAFLLVAFAISG